ncbi:MAG: folate-binding protein YgfZ [Actinobacteria bacterium]|nr:folate-binding protein YgfZ [Actinomycetota bacterium]MCB0920551.1 folate-binding protein YgfZ [Actinomycetota bacterium]TXH32728.1 MAG: folate-binding protein [Actinomycetota bacterium]HNE90118.1 folate-binding protein [Actinomycetota bacterium]
MTHFGDPFAEQKLLAAGEGWVALPHRAVLRLTGSDRITWLDSLTSHRIASDASTQALILDPNGHVEYDLHVVDTGEATWLIVDADTADALRTYLDRMRFMADVEVTDLSDEHDVVWVPRREQYKDLPTWLIPAEYAGMGTTDSGEDRGGTAAKYVPARPDRLIGAEVVFPRSERPAGPECGTWALQALRIAAGVPEVGADTDHKSLPHELGLIGPAVHLAKGCYRGQETVARLHNMGRPPRRLVLLHFDGALPDPGTEVFAGDRSVGRVGSVAQHHELGPIGLAVIKRSTPVDAQLSVDDIDASQEAVVAAL